MAAKLSRRATEEQNPPPEVRTLVAALVRYFSGEPVEFDGIEIEPAGDPFARRVYEAARRIGWGRTVTYGELAKQIGEAEAAREVGQALARNQLPLIVPCHRVLAAGGRIGGFSAPGGVATKARMLELEGVRVGDTRQGSLFAPGELLPAAPPR
jgi:methylated-DNA-[protein]-cysteine S-methyltransferase